MCVSVQYERNFPIDFWNETLPDIRHNKVNYGHSRPMFINPKMHICTPTYLRDMCVQYKLIYPHGFPRTASKMKRCQISDFSPNVNQIIINTQKTTTSNLNTIQLTVHKMSHPQAFRVAIFFKMSSVGHLVFNEFFPKVNQIILEIHREP